MSMRVAADLLGVAAGEADPVADSVAVADPVDDDENTVEVDEGSVDEETLLGRIPHSCANSRRPVASVASKFCTQFAQVVIVVAPNGVNGAQEHASEALHARDVKYAVKVEEH
jgi:hypothetical protein